MALNTRQPAALGPVALKIALGVMALAWLAVLAVMIPRYEHRKQAARQTIEAWSAHNAARGAFLVKIHQNCGAFRPGWANEPQGNRLDRHLTALCVAQAVHDTPGMTPQALQTLRTALLQDGLDPATLTWTDAAAP